MASAKASAAGGRATPWLIGPCGGRRKMKVAAAASRIGAARTGLGLACGHFLISVSRMMAVSLLGLEIFRRHALEVGRSEAVVGGEQFVDRLRPARGRHGRADRVGDGVGRAQRAGECVAKMRLDRVQSGRVDRRLGGLGQGRGDPRPHERQVFRLPHPYEESKTGPGRASPRPRPSASRPFVP